MNFKKGEKKVAIILFVTFMTGLIIFSGVNGLFTDISASSEVITTELNPTVGHDWVTMHYIDGDNDLEEMAIDDINEMEAGLGSANIIHLALIDRTSGYDSSNGDWTGTRLYEITSDSTSTITSTLIYDFGELNMGDGSSLQLFIEYVFDNYTSPRYWLNIWDHGGGIDGLCWDDTSSSQSLDMDEMQTAIANAETNYAEYIDVISHDACFMNMFEVAYELKDLTDYFVSSEESVPGDGFDYEAIFAAMDADPTMSSEELIEILVNTYDTFYSSLYGDVTLSAINLTVMDEFTEYANYFAQNLTYVLADGQGSGINDAFFETQTFYDDYIVDFQHFVERILANTTLKSAYSGLNESASNLLDEFEDLISFNFQGTAYSGNANGVTIFMPYKYSSYVSYINMYTDDMMLFDNLDWLQDSYWDEFLDDFYDLGFGILSSTYDELALDETISNANIAEDASDYYELNFATTGIYEITMSVSSGDADLELYQFGTDALVGYSRFWNPEDGSVEKIRIHLPSGVYILEVYGFYASIYTLTVTQNDPIEIDLDDTQSGSGGTQDGTGETGGYHYWQIYAHYYEITLEPGTYDLTLTYNNYDVDFDLFVYSTSFSFVDSSETTTNEDLVTLTVSISTTYIICVYGYSGYGSFSFIAEVHDEDGGGPTGFIPGYTTFMTIFGLLAISIVTMVLLKRKRT